MASCVQTHARIRLNFVNSPLDSVWMLVDYKKLPLISDIVYEINKRYFGGKADLSLSLQGSCLPPDEISLLLRDEDAVTVRVEKQDGDYASTSIHTGGETKKRKHEDTGSEEVSTKIHHNDHGSSNEEDWHAKKKRKKEHKRKERERLKEIADIVSFYTDQSRGHSSRHDSTKDVPSSSKRAYTDSHSRDQSNKDSSKVYAGTSEPVKTGESDRENKLDRDTYHHPDRKCHCETDKDRDYDVSPDKQHQNECEKDKKKRHRKHRKHRSKKSSPENLPNVNLVEQFADNVNQQYAGTSHFDGAATTDQFGWDQNASTYTGKPVTPGQIFYGSLPDKLLQPKYYRHEYHNLRQYSAQPNTHRKFPSDSETEEKEETHNLEQYNFLCSTRCSEFQEPNNEEAASIPDAFPDTGHDNFNASSTPNISEGAKEQISNRSEQNNNEMDVDEMNGDLSNEIRQENDSKKNKSNNNTNTNAYSGESTSCNEYNGYTEDEHLNSATRAPPTSLVQSKLPNGVTVYSRQRRCKPKAEVFSKEQQLNDVATNRSFIVQNPSEHNTVANDKFVVDKEEILHAEKVQKDYTKFPALTGPPRIGDRIAYKILEMSSSYTPEVSDYKEAEVLSFDQATQNVQLKNLFKSDSCKSLFGNKFDISIEYGDTLLTNVEEELDEATFHWNSLLEPRLVS